MTKHNFNGSLTLSNKTLFTNKNTREHKFQILVDQRKFAKASKWLNYEHFVAFGLWHFYDLFWEHNMRMFV